ncbi:MAG: DUF402 domain-containing protein [Chloroflexi bacterium]|nr:DUF402 domain-containing protein [Chloroflexota bacterium]
MVEPSADAEITVVSIKYDGSFHRRQTGWLIEQRGPLIILRHRAGVPVEFPHSTWEPETDAIAHYWTDRWYIIYRVVDESGSVIRWYCNFSTPAEFDGESIRYIDLDLDITVQKDFTYYIHDEEEFKANTKQLHYPRKVVKAVGTALDEVLGMVERREFPFD